MQKQEFLEAIHLLEEELNWKLGNYKEPSILKRTDCFYQLNEGIIGIRWEIEIVYSSIWALPVIYFRGFTSSGEMIPSELERKVISESLFNVSIVVNRIHR
jgi:hypothetical protein